MGGPPGVHAMRTGIAQLRSSGSFARMPYWLSLLADRLIHDGQDESARAVLGAAEAAACQRNDLWWLPQVLRMRARLEPDPVAANLLDRADRLTLEQRSPFHGAGS
ncbi:hypothetical protein IV498_17945 [Paenarthrobacter sp. Z7-10]|uniref:hypothetical protein n=1 Tax=Paenarthrobacter sp. Z7-10 TaxID=2787635 RepID=UPI0022A9B6F5|nr:hypothetical protein [Paenarthrobacter sp. Z7-10]MCZ2404991.1 hypothetical protein [Paenarthrobacter sp. Z7-10]